MDDQEDRRKDYDKKKFQNEKHKKVKETLSEQEEYTVKLIDQMSAKALLAFIEDKYEKLIAKNEKLMYLMNQQIAKRIPLIKIQFIEEQKGKINKFVQKHTNRELKQDEMKKIYQQKWGTHYFETKPKIMVQTKAHAEFGYILAVIVNPQEENKKIEHFYFGNKEDEMFFEVGMKRLKKESIEILSNFVEFEAKVSQLKYIP